MTRDDLLVPAVLVAAVLVLLVVLLVVVRAQRRERARARAELDATRAESTELRRRVDALARQVEERQREAGSDTEFVITEIGREAPEPAPAPRIEGRLFVDLVVRESVVKGASLAHGVRRALAPETRNRIRFAMKQEVKRARKARRIEIRDVRREMAARRAAEKSEGAA